MFNLWWWSINCWAITIVSGQGVVHERILLRGRLAPQRGQDLGWDLLILGGILLFNFYDLRDIQTLTVRRTKQWNIIRCFIFKFCTGDKSIPGLVLIKRPYLKLGQNLNLWTQTKVPKSHIQTGWKKIKVYGGYPDQTIRITRCRFKCLTMSPFIFNYATHCVQMLFPMTALQTTLKQIGTRLGHLLILVI